MAVKRSRSDSAVTGTRTSRGPEACGALAICLLIAAAMSAWAFPAGSGPQQTSAFGERVSSGSTPDDVRFTMVAPAAMDAGLPTLLVIYATPNGNSIEETLGRRPKNPAEWRFDIQHVAAQVRRYREVATKQNTVLVCLEAPGKSWPAWCNRQPDAGAVLRRIVAGFVRQFPAGSTRVCLTGHSGGGAFLLRYIEAGEAIPAMMERIVFLDADYSYSDERGHGDRLLAWLAGDKARRLVVVAYDDRTVTLDGKPVVSTDGGTYRATLRMKARLGKAVPLTDSLYRDFDAATDSERKIGIFVNRNYANRILHTALVGDMNGVLQGLTFGAPEEKAWGVFGGQRAYTKWIEPADGAGLLPAIPPRPADAETGATFVKRLAAMNAAEREAEILRAVTGGNIPDFERAFRRVTVSGKDAAGAEHTVGIDVMPDYLAVGSDSDFFRVPMMPATAQAIAGRFGCLLPTTRLVDEIYRAAEVKLPPRPLTEEREAVTTFVQHNTIIEEQRAAVPCGPVMAGHKKDIVITNRLLEKDHRVAIYGWHREDGRPIQPLTTAHGDTYVDYSHGVRLISRRVLLDGKPKDLLEILRDANLAVLLSDEGPLKPGVIAPD